MTALSMLTLALTHPGEFRTLCQYWLYHESKRDITATREHPTSGWDRATMRRCWDLLDLTSRSFSAVIKELDGDLARTICLFYVVLRGLDTIEDDMTIPDDIKQPILRSFHEKTVTPGWKFNGSGPAEKDRIVLQEYDTVVEEVNLLDPGYRAVIVDICHKMEIGMADYAHRAATTGSIYLSTVADYDLYCHYVAGLVGEGLSRIWGASGKEAPWLASQLGLSNSMGLLLQKTNIIRDFREDADERRFFWPREIWGRKEYATRASGPCEDVTELLRVGNEEQAQWVQSGMVLDALRHATDSLDYLRLLRNQTVFNFCAIPAAMAMATLNLCFMNPEMFQRHIKIRKAEAAKLIMASTNPRDVAYLFRDYVRQIHAKASPADPNFTRLSVACAKIEQWAEHHFPSFVHIGTPSESALDTSDARARIVALSAAWDDEKKRERDALATTAGQGQGQGQTQQQQQQQGPPWDLMAFFAGAMLLIMGLSVGIVLAVLKIWG
ncbi:squalene synthetase [Heterobasidion irregulare TC 32-1]|uniref:Squalene synthase n=1 Tax=Heterobasidion irregulare (strain TC 32-1) TaxID=747525 RepID=W4JY52_HETIT|nr:squalene synthetase [Heterobasidion irregulare TC 32-1]ETW78512.1 squalene synthetase [Heterobasidion irregulare TC 32-1]